MTLESTVQSCLALMEPVNRQEGARRMVQLLTGKVDALILMEAFELASSENGFESSGAAKAIRELRDNVIPFSKGAA